MPLTLLFYLWKRKQIILILKVFISHMSNVTMHVLVTLVSNVNVITLFFLFKVIVITLVHLCTSELL